MSLILSTLRHRDHFGASPLIMTSPGCTWPLTQPPAALHREVRTIDRSHCVITN